MTYNFTTREHVTTTPCDTRWPPTTQHCRLIGKECVKEVVDRVDNIGYGQENIKNKEKKRKKKK